MAETVTSASPSFSRQQGAQLQELREIIEQAALLLPSQGPITGFAFLNTLQALEDRPFHEGLVYGAQVYNCQPYLSEERYHAEMARDRIRVDDLAAVLREDLQLDLDDSAIPFGTTFDLRMAMLRYPLSSGPDAEMHWFIAETDALSRMRREVSSEAREQFVRQTRHWMMRDIWGREDDGASNHGIRLGLVDIVEHFGAPIEQWSESTWESFALRVLWRVCRQGVQGVPRPKLPPAPLQRHRDAVLEITGVDSDSTVNSVLIPFCASFIDQGFAPRSLPERELGMFRSFCRLYGHTACASRWLKGLKKELCQFEESGTTPLESIVESLRILGVAKKDWNDYLTMSLLATRGFAGMIWQMEVRPDRVPFPASPGTLVEFLAIRLILDRYALNDIASTERAVTRPLCDLVRHPVNRKSVTRGVEQRAFSVFQLAQILGWLPQSLHNLTKQQWTTLVEEIDAFSALERRRVFHLAYERHYRVEALDALACYARRPPDRRVANPSFQSVYCLDTRSESLRRHLEEVLPSAETFGTAGFYNIPIYYRGVADAFFAALCPIVVRPSHWLTENVVFTFEDENLRRARARKAIAAASHQIHLGSRNVASGALLAAGVGVLASIPMVARILFPRMTAVLRRWADRFVQPPPNTRLVMERLADEPGHEPDQIGFTLKEMADFGQRALTDIGLTRGFSRLVMFFGHGSHSLNNPHKSTYDCGACTGSPGSPNARALAAMLNDIRVRQMLAERDLIIPDTTYFLGGLHNTGDDSVSFLDLDLLPPSHLQDFKAAKDALAEACRRNAHERCRRFDSAPLDISVAAAHRHAGDRCDDLAQTRPEYGNCTNAMTIVGRRDRTRGLYLDRRSFLMSYDPEQDDDDKTILGRILAAVVPVCEGINLQYTLSYIDSMGFGCGSKLPHNITSLLGVMDGASSDLRAGLAWQGVDIHEPMRMLFVLETTPEGIRKIMARDDNVRRILENGWAQLALLDPHSADILVFRHGEFHPHRSSVDKLPTRETSIDWYRGWRGHLGFAEIGSLESPSAELAD